MEALLSDSLHRILIGSGKYILCSLDLVLLIARLGHLWSHIYSGNQIRSCGNKPDQPRSFLAKFWEGISRIKQCHSFGEPPLMHDRPVIITFQLLDLDAGDLRLVVLPPFGLIALTCDLRQRFKFPVTSSKRV